MVNLVLRKQLGRINQLQERRARLEEAIRRRKRISRKELEEFARTPEGLVSFFLAGSFAAMLTGDDPEVRKVKSAARQGLLGWLTKTLTL